MIWLVWHTYGHTYIQEVAPLRPIGRENNKNNIDIPIFIKKKDYKILWNTYWPFYFYAIYSKNQYLKIRRICKWNIFFGKNSSKPLTITVMTAYAILIQLLGKVSVVLLTTHGAPMVAAIPLEKWERCKTIIL